MDAAHFPELKCLRAAASPGTTPHSKSKILTTHLLRLLLTRRILELIFCTFLSLLKPGMSLTWRMLGLCRSSSRATSRRWRCPFLPQTDPTLPNKSCPGVKQHLLDVAHGGHLVQALGQVQPGGGHEGGEHPVSSDFCSINLVHINIIIIMVSYNFTFPPHLNQWSSQ